MILDLQPLRLVAYDQESGTARALLAWRVEPHDPQAITLERVATFTGGEVFPSPQLYAEAIRRGGAYKPEIRDVNIARMAGMLGADGLEPEIDLADRLD